jgi:predicted O-methyltransferase YrrM
LEEVKMSEKRWSFLDAKAAATLEFLHDEAERGDEANFSEARDKLAKREEVESKERAELLEKVYMPVSPDAGRLLYMLTRIRKAVDIVEFGTSFGISTIYLAAAVRDNGGGMVVTTELSESKAKRALRNIEQAGLADYVELREGDALETLKTLPATPDFVFLDGWKNLYLPVLQLLEPKLAPDTVIVADDLAISPEALAPYLAHVRNPKNGYASEEIRIDDGFEISIAGAGRS